MLLSLLGTTALGAALAATAAPAGPAVGAEEDRAAVTSSAETGGEVVVTATKRAARAQDVPLSLTVVDADTIAEQHLKDGIALARQTPNLVAESAMGAAMPRFRLRGIGTNDFTPTTASPVGVYEDEVYISAASGLSRPLYDLDHVEVLRGPQGTLWGKNTTSGAIHYVTTKPGGTSSGQAQLSYGTDDTREAEAGLGGPLGERLSYRVAGVYKHRDGQFVNDATGREAGGYEIWDLRAQLRWELAPGATLLVKGHGGRTRQDQPLQHVGILAGGADSDGYVERADRDALSNNGRGDTSAHRAGFDAQLDVDLGGATLTNIAAFEWADSLIYSDDDANPISRYHERYGGGSHTFTDELRLASPDTDQLGWIVGGYYLHDRTNSFGQLGLYSPTNFGVNGIGYDLDVTTDNLAGFASLSYRVTPRLKLVAGARYTWERKGIEGRAFEYATNPSDVFDSRDETIVYVDTRAGRSVDESGAPLAPVTPHRAWRKLTWDASADYALSDAAHLFARVARGFRSGNYNTYIATPGDLSVYDPETLTSYEAGIKTNLLDRRLTLNLTGFHYDFDDMQVTVLQDAGTRTQNAAAARVNGLELEAVARPLAGLSLNAGWGYQDSRYKDFTDASVPFPINRGAPLDLSGQPLERAPRHTVNLAASYETPLGTGTLRLNTDWRYTSRYRFHVWSDATNNDPAPFLADASTRQLVRDTFSQDDLWLGNATVAYRLPSGVEVAAWVRNLTDRAYNTNAFGMFFNRSISTYPGERRTAGVSLSYRF
ncbi:TonB-dependent receptor [Sphingomonas sp. BK580]|uniref:TonB-dependent receptor n=1 Tax=Sphingomonas sp. BK580 TaxID=2586972 RepID=UPI00161513F4|nr:TonB-dependent receptor [Sphingomonas sp. BK580]MBB3691404.1 iron complex outermembrane receptor protein [Sphingomonas sp. BK580]